MPSVQSYSYQLLFPLICAREVFDHAQKEVSSKWVVASGLIRGLPTSHSLLTTSLNSVTYYHVTRFG